MLFNRDFHANWKKLVHQDMVQVVTRVCYCKAAPFLVSPMIADMSIIDLDRDPSRIVNEKAGKGCFVRFLYGFKDLFLSYFLMYFTYICFLYVGD